jgi:hypothetical protein
MSFFLINKHSLEVFKYQLLQLTSRRGKAFKLVSVLYQLVTRVSIPKYLQLTYVKYLCVQPLFFSNKAWKNTLHFL